MNTEILTWDMPVALFGESKPVEGGYQTRLHADFDCRAALTPNSTWKVRKVHTADASVMCTACTPHIVSDSISNAVVALRNIAFLMKKAELLSDARKAVKEAREIGSIHPQAVEALALVEEAFEEVEPELPVG